MDDRFQAQNAIQKKVRERQQQNEYWRVNKHGRAYCLLCFGIDDNATARVVNICHDCLRKKGLEAILVKVKTDYYGICYDCGLYKFTVHHVNCRVCMKCQGRIAGNLRERNRKGIMATDPFWRYIRKRYGHLYAPLFARKL